VYAQCRFEMQSEAEAAARLLVYQPQLERVTESETLPSPYAPGGAVVIDAGRIVGVEELSALAARLGEIDIDNMATIGPGGALRALKYGHSDMSDGIYFGSPNEGNFQFTVTRTSEKGTRQEMDLRDDRFVLTNAKFRRNFGRLKPPEIISGPSRTITIPAGSKSISVSIVGGGGGGGHHEDGPGGDGTATTVTLRDGTRVVRTWTAAGGAGGEAVWPQTRGRPSIFAEGGGRGRKPGRSSGGPGRLGSGGGGAKRGGHGGRAGRVRIVERFDISGLTAPNIVFERGVGGQAAHWQAGRGGDGAMQYSLELSDGTVDADVLPILPTDQGTILKRGHNFTFPPHGAGLWILWDRHRRNVDLGVLRIGPGIETQVYYGLPVVFLASETPTYLRDGHHNDREIDYLFYKMGQ
ncbi:MAG: hypothetical protein Q4G20_13605, partial [Paracoccus sp. (in: a-proteobacteria)]|nr:hypothetical protein [Paracoccus sp. (in: a-proteobacteria)]